MSATEALDNPDANLERENVPVATVEANNENQGTSSKNATVPVGLEESNGTIGT